MQTRQRINPEVIVSALLWCAALLTGYYFFNRVIIHERFGFHDWYLFIAHAKQFVLTGTLYDRNLSLYGPSAAIYKFPPLYASILIFFLNCGFSEETIKLLTQIIYLCCYFFSFAIFLRLAQHTRRSPLIPMALIIAFSFEPFFDNYTSAQMEIYILLLLTLSLLYLLRGRDLLSGFFIGVATAIKIYPIYFAGYYLAHKKYSAIAGVILGVFAVSVFSLALIGWTEHVFYFSQILPTLLAEPISGKGENISIARLILALNVPIKIAGYSSVIILLMPIAVILCLSMFNSRIQNRQNSVIWFSIFITTFLLATKNSWLNYQILLVIPLLAILSVSLDRSKTACLILATLLIAYLMIFWCNLGKLDVLMVFFTNILNASPLLTSVMLKINLLRGLATFLILLALVFSLRLLKSKNISLVENRLNT